MVERVHKGHVVNQATSIIQIVTHLKIIILSRIQSNLGPTL